MTKEETYAYLRDAGVEFETVEHKAVYNMAELDSVELPYPEWDAKNLFVRDDKKRNFYLISVKGDKKVDIKEFRKANGLRPLSFASADDLKSYMALEPGSVTPLGLLNDTECKVALFLDDEFSGHKIGVHPNDNTATVFMAAEDLVRVIRAHGNEVRIVGIS